MRIVYVILDERDKNTTFYGTLILKVLNDAINGKKKILIDFKFQRFEIAGPNSADLTTSNEGIVGDCSTDKFSIAVTGSAGSPVICGKNSNQHSKFHMKSNE